MRKTTATLIALLTVVGLPVTAAPEHATHTVELDGVAVLSFSSPDPALLDGVRYGIDADPTIVPELDTHPDLEEGQLLPVAPMTAPVPVIGNTLTWTAPEGVNLVLARAGGDAPQSVGTATLRLDDSDGGMPSPTIIRRSAWGADEAATRTISTHDLTEFFVVHHTAGTNDYTEDEADDIVRAIQRFHLHGRGWSDIAYNFLIDKFGNIYEGRRDSATKPIQGAHASGWNAGSVGIALLGDFASTDPTNAALDALTDLVAWKADVHHVDLLSEFSRRSSGGGSNRHASGSRVELPVVYGHRTTNYTSCPGAHLDAWLHGHDDPEATLAHRATGRYPWKLTDQLPSTDVISVDDNPYLLRFRPPHDHAVSINVDNGEQAERLPHATSAPDGTAVATIDPADHLHGEQLTITATAHPHEGAAVAAPGFNGVRPANLDLHVVDVDSRLHGPDRVATAIAISAHAFDTSEHVVLVSASTYADAVVASPLAAVYDAPVLLVNGAVNDELADELARLQVQDVLIVGGSSAVAPHVQQQLEQLGYETARLAGPDRFATAVAVAKHIRTKSTSRGYAIAVGRHEDPVDAFADALIAGRWGAQHHIPLLLSASDHVPATTLAALRDADLTDGVVVFGNDEVFEPKAYEQVADAVADGVAHRRLAGATRFDTAYLAALEVRTAIRRDGKRADELWISSGDNWPDALAGAAASVHLGAPMLLTPARYPAPQVSRFIDRKDVTHLWFTGGGAAISNSPVVNYRAVVVDELRDDLRR